MVDIGATARTTRVASRDGGTGRAAAGVSVEVRPADDAALAVYEAFCAEALHAPAQHPLWVRSWIEAVEADAFVATVHRDGQPAVAVALEVVREGPFRIARFVGGRHANGNFTATSRDAARPLSPGEGQAFTEALRDARPDVDLVILERQHPQREGTANPFSGMATMRSPNVSLAVDLSGGFDAMLARRNGKRKRKKYRLQLRRFDEAGGFRLIEARAPEEVERLISEFYVMKAARFRKHGIADVFGTQQVQAFFRRLFLGALGRQPLPFALYGVEVGGEIRSVNGFSVLPDGLVCEFCAMRDDDLHISPGFFLDYATMELACERGMDVYDFSVGDEEYKRSWCDIETWQFDTLLPLTARGRMLRAFKVVRAGAVRSVKSNEALWSLARRMRARLAGAQRAGED